MESLRWTMAVREVFCSGSHCSHILIQSAKLLFTIVLAVQGSCVPVYLGTIDRRSMDKIYYYDQRVYVVHLAFISWAGRRLDEMGQQMTERMRIAGGTLQPLGTIHQAGVVPTTCKEPNYCSIRRRTTS